MIDIFPLMINMTIEVFLIGGEKTINLKKAIARILYSKKIEQSKISEILNLSQPMVSNYCSTNEKVPQNTMKIAQEITEKIIKGNKINFQTCITFSEKDIQGNFFIADKNEILTDENSKIIDNLKQAFYNLKEKDIKKFIPAVKINIAMSKKNAKKSDDVASFLNGLIISEDKITGYNSIRFGKSKHLSSIIIKLGKKLDSNAIMNIAYTEEIEKTKFKTGFLTKDFKLKESGKNFDILIHKGDFGIEPCAYILGKDAVDVTDKLLKIVKEAKI
jgi:XRE family transcriptional regulator, thiamine biosynthesis regulator